MVRICLCLHLEFYGLGFGLCLEQLAFDLVLFVN